MEFRNPPVQPLRRQFGATRGIWVAWTIALVLSSESSATAGALDPAKELAEEARDLIRDPIKLDKFGANAVEAAQVFDRIVQRLEVSTLKLSDKVFRELNQMLELLREGTADAIRQVFKRAHALERAIQTSFIKVIRESECAGKRLALSDFPESARRITRTLDGVSIDLGAQSLFKIRIPPAQAVPPPDKVFRETRRRVTERLEALGPSSDPTEVISLHENLAQFAYDTICFYSASDGAVRDLELAAAEFKRRAASWRQIGGVSLAGQD